MAKFLIDIYDEKNKETVTEEIIVKQDDIGDAVHAIAKTLQEKQEIVKIEPVIPKKKKK